MKAIPILSIILLLGTSTSVQAQLWKNLTKKAQEAAERTIERKVEEKSERETEKSFDSVFNNQGKLFKGKKELPADTYSFSTKYTMEIIDAKNTTTVNYYFSDGENYFGSSVPTKNNEDMITVIDVSQQTAHTFMESGNSKTMMSFGFDLSGKVDETMEESEAEIVKTGKTKDILGYMCEEYQVKSKDSEGTMWVTQDAGVSFSSAFTNLSTSNLKGVKGMNQAWISSIQGLTMEMLMTDTSKNKARPIHMRCIALEPSNLKIETGNYQKTF